MTYLLFNRRLIFYLTNILVLVLTLGHNHQILKFRNNDLVRFNNSLGLIES